MCGIAGTIDLHEPPTQALLERMAVPLSRRGPDEQGVYAHGPCGLAHRRLSVIDVEGGHQPIFNEDGTLALICNGEIYDYGALRTELEEQGHTFSTGSDNEVVLHLYEENGATCVDELNGMFAFAIFDLQKNRLFVARDRFGQKPLFYATAPGRVAVASGTRSLLELPWVDDELDYAAIHDYLEFQYIPAPRSIYRGIRKLLPGQCALWDVGEGKDKPQIIQICADYAAGDVGLGRGRASATESDRISADQREPRLLHSDFNAGAAELRMRFTAAVERRMVADVPVGLFLSGGIDSGLVCAAAQRMASQPVQTFSIGFPVREYDEREEASRVAEFLGTDHHFLEVNPSDIEHLEDLVSEFEEPFCDASMLPVSLLSRFTRESVTVALSGDGADELFGGYDRYRVMRWLQRWSKLPRGLRRTAKAALSRLAPSAPHERTFAGKLGRVADLLDREGADAYRAVLSRFPESLRVEMYGEAMAGYGTGRKKTEDNGRRKITEDGRRKGTEDGRRKKTEEDGRRKGTEGGGRAALFATETDDRTRNSEPGTRNPEPGTPNSEPGTPNPEPGTPNPEPSVPASWHGDWAAAAMAEDLAMYLPNDILVKVDRASMAHGLEVRSPFLDPELAELALGMPRNWKLKGRHGKHILRSAFRGYLPDETFARGKMGFGVPVAHWLRNEWEGLLRDLLPDGKTVELGIFRGERLEWMIDQHCREGRDYSYPLFAILVLELWLRK